MARWFFVAPDRGIDLDDVVCVTAHGESVQREAGITLSLRGGHKFTIPAGAAADQALAALHDAAPPSGTPAPKG